MLLEQQSLNVQSFDPARILWFENSRRSRLQPRFISSVKRLGVTQARVSDIKRGKINSFSLDMLVKLAARAGLHPRLEFVA